MNQPTDRPPILLFLMMFTGLLAVAVCLAALAQAGRPADDIGSTLSEHRSDRMSELSQTPQRDFNLPSPGEPAERPASRRQRP
jgi:hypothetical protein